MFDTNIVIVGNVLTAPEWRRTPSTNTLVSHFRVASTARRMDKDTGRWIDGDSLRVRVTCWRRLAEGVAASIAVGDPVVVTGRLYTRDWTDGDGNARTSFEMEAAAVGHDLARGKGRFFRHRSAPGTGVVEDPGTEHHVRGEATELVPDDEAPARYGDGVHDPEFIDGFDPVAAVRGSELTDEDLAALSSGEPPASSGPPAPASPTPPASASSSVAAPDGSEGPRRPRRAGRRVPQPA